MNQRMRGFTMVELMITVALLGLLTALSVATLGPLRDRYTRRQAAELAASAAARAQLLARETGRCHRLEVYTTDASGNPIEVTNIGDPGDRLRLQRRTTADCEHDDPKSLGELEHVEWVRMPGRVRVRIQTAPGSPMPEWRPNSRLRQNLDTQLRVGASGSELVIRLMKQGPVCVSEATLEDCP
jgi:prepilin-type N-terminal cleavage/methylation domain-containing protein